MSIKTDNSIFELIRLPGDARSITSELDTDNQVIQEFFLEDLVIHPDVVPAVSMVIDDVCKNLNLHPDQIISFIYSSPFLQAECYPYSESKCIVRLSSAIVEKLESSELAFVVGHELGHYLLGHLQERVPSKRSYEHLIFARRRELSVDRVGLIACRSLPSALSAMMKTMSGLSNSHLRFNTASFIAQLRNYDKDEKNVRQLHKTHPSWLIRCRALLWFSLNRYFSDLELGLDVAHLEDINLRIINDLEKYFDSQLIEEIAKVENDLKFWINAKEIIDSGHFSKLRQTKCEDEFGVYLTEKLKNLLGSITKDEAFDHVIRNLHNSFSLLNQLAPRAAARYKLPE
jgi:hypothetical protein